MTTEHDAFAAALEDCCRRVASGEALARCLGDYPSAYHEELSQLVPTALRVGVLGREPTAAFQARLERDLLEQVDARRLATRRSPRRWLAHTLGRQPLLRTATVAALALVVLFGSGATVLQASEDSLPDSPLYQVKDMREALRLLVTRDPEQRVVLHAAQIAQRGRELERAVSTQRRVGVIQLLALRLAASTDQLVEQALQIEARGNPQPARRADEALGRMQAQLDRLIQRAAPEQRPPLQRLRALLAREQGRLESE